MQLALHNLLFLPPLQVAQAWVAGGGMSLLHTEQHVIIFNTCIDYQ